jgi:hypothetical protein
MQRALGGTRCSVVPPNVWPFQLSSRTQQKLVTPRTSGAPHLPIYECRSTPLVLATKIPGRKVSLNLADTVKQL